MKSLQRTAACLFLFALVAGAQIQIPVVTGLLPSSATVGDPSLNLTITGNNFLPGASVLWNATTPLATTYVSSTTLIAMVPGSLFVTPGFVFITVLNPGGGGSGAASFTVLGSPLVITTTSLPAAVVGVPYSAGLIATGGAAPYSWYVVDALPPGLILNSSGTISGTPTTAGTVNFTVRVVDRNQTVITRLLSITISAPALLITSASPLAAATASVQYSYTFNATGGTPPYRWSISGQPPDTLKLDATIGSLSGIPQTRGSYTFTVQVADTTGTTASKSFTLVINPPPLVITTEAPLFNGTLTTFYSQTFFASGGVLPYKWTLTGQTPTGLVFDSVAGALTGTPTAQGTFTFTIQVADSTGTTTSKTFSITIDLPKLTITTASQLTSGAVGTNYSQQFAATGGSPPYTWLLLSGSIAGLTLNSNTATLSGTPTTPGTYNFTVQVRDSTGGTANRSFTLTVDPRPLTITTVSPVPAGAIGSAYSATMTAFGGIPPYTWSANGLPAGLSLDPSTGLITGTPQAAGDLSFTVRVADTARSAVTALFRISISLPAVPSLTITGLTTTVDPATQMHLRARIGSPYPVPIDGQLLLSFAPETGAGDSTIQFSSGGRSLAFSIPAGSTDAVFSMSDPAFQTGTVAGVISVSATLQAVGVDVTPSPAPGTTTTVNRAAPVIASAKFTRNGSTLSIQVTGYSTAREVTQAVVHFNVASGNTLQQSDITVPVESLFSSWFQDPSSSRFGSQFTLTQPFTVQGDANAITPASVTLVNRVGSTTTSIN